MANKIIEDIHISDRTMKEIKTAIGGPVVTNEFEFIYTDEEILDLVIAPALETYYSYFPILVPIERQVSGAPDLITIDAPPNSLGIIRQQFIPLSSSNFSQNDPLSQGSFYGNPFATFNQVLSIGGYGSNRYGTPFGYGAETIQYQQRFFQKSTEQMNKATYIHYDDVNDKINLKTAISGVFYLEIATWSSDVDGSIPIRRRQQFIKYCKGLLKTRFAEILMNQSQELPGNIDYDKMNDSGEKMIDEALQYFQNTSTIPVLR